MLDRTLRRVAVVATASVAVVVVWLPTPASAQTQDVQTSASVSVTTSTTPPNPDDGIDGAFGGSPTSLLQGLLCPVVTAVSGATSEIPGVGPVLDQLPGIVCAINVAGYVYRTTYVPETGPKVIRYTRALVGVPALIDVDGKGLPDFTGLIGIALPGLSLQLSRSLLFPASAKVSIEAIAIVPGMTGTYVGFGEDGLAAGTAKHWKAALTVAGLTATTADLKLAIDTLNPPTSLAAIGEMFSGADPDQPERTYRGNAAFSPVPASLTTEIVASKARQQVTVTSPPTTLTAKVDVLSPGRAQNIQVVADQLPSKIEVVHTSTDDTHSTTTYQADGPIAKLTGTYVDKNTETDSVTTSAALDAWGVPADITFDQAGDKTTVAANGAGKFDRVQARFAQGGDVGPLETDPAPFAKYDRTADRAFTAGLQLSDVKSVSINQGAPYGGELVFADAPALFPFVADDHTDGTHLEGSLSNLPLDTTVTADLDNGQVTFDGHGTGIDEIVLKATRPTPFFAEATRVEATLEDLPALETVNFAQVNGAVKASASQPLGTITLLASDGADAPTMAGSGAQYIENDDTWLAFLRITGLESVGFQMDPIVGEVRTSDSQVFKVKGEKSGVTFGGTIDSLPSHMTFSMQPGAGGGNVVDFDSDGEKIGSITVNGDGLPAPAGMPKFEAKILDLPSHLTITLPAGAGGKARFDAHGDHITRVYAQAHGSITRGVDPSRQLLAYSEGKFIAVNLLDVGNAEVSTAASPFRIKYDIGSQPLDYAVQVPGTDVHGVILRPQPATVTFQPFDKDADGEGGVKVTYDVDPAHATGDGSIERIGLTATIDQAFIDATIDDIPAHLDICLQTEQGTLCKPGYVPGTATGRTVVNPSFAMHFFPRDLSGNVPSTPVVVNGVVCPDEPNASTCADTSVQRARILVQGLRFKTVEAAFGSNDEHCHVACGTVWGAANTAGPGSPVEGDHLNGRLRYWDGSGDNGGDPQYDLDLNPTAAFVAFNHLFFFAHYDAAPIPSLDAVVNGTMTCGDDPNLTIGIDDFSDIDVLSGTFGGC